MTVAPAPRPWPAGLVAAAERARRVVRDVDRLGVAFSGGADSSVLLALSLGELGPGRVVAILGVSASLAASERASAHSVAAALGARVVEVPTREGEVAAYRRNGPDRCFHCRNELFTRIADDVVAALGVSAVAYGENADDAGRADRPGSAAARDHRVLAPLAEAGLSKADVRAIGRLLEVPSADKPAAPCLASRIPHFTEVTPARLAQVETAEQALRDLGLAELRVRHHGSTARVELGPDELARAGAPALRARIEQAVLGAGFGAVVVDPGGLRSGAFTLSALRDT